MAILTDTHSLSKTNGASQEDARVFMASYACPGCRAQVTIDRNKVRVWHLRFCKIRAGLVARHPAALNWIR